MLPVGTNQYEHKIHDGVLFFSYQTPVAAKLRGRLFVTDQRFSLTTTKHINRWIAEQQQDEICLVHTIPQLILEVLAGV